LNQDLIRYKASLSSEMQRQRGLLERLFSKNPELDDDMQKKILSTESESKKVEQRISRLQEWQRLKDQADIKSRQILERIQLLEVERHRLLQYAEVRLAVTKMLYELISRISFS
jgi:hypothetical protein